MFWCFASLLQRLHLYLFFSFREDWSYENLRAAVEVQVWANGDCERGQCRPDRAGPETGGSTPNSHGHAPLEDLPGAPQAILRPSHRVSMLWPFSFQQKDNSRSFIWPPCSVQFSCNYRNAKINIPSHDSFSSLETLFIQILAISNFRVLQLFKEQLIIKVF